MYLLGLDIGSSSVKVALVDGKTGQCLGTAGSPDTEMAMLSLETGWAEQHPDLWWEHLKKGLAKLAQRFPSEYAGVKAIGISYQMHGLVLVDEQGEVLRPSIIWCDSRAVSIGEEALAKLGEDYCLQHYLNSPGNFTASKLRWVQQNEPEVFAKVKYAMLPGDYIAYKLTGEAFTTVSGLSEGIFWDFKNNEIAKELLNHYQVDTKLLPEIKDSFSNQGSVAGSIAKELGLPEGVVVTYRAGDQPNNALSLNVCHPGEVAANAGTSGVLYGVIDQVAYDPKSRVNTFSHPNSTASQLRLGVLACINGTGIMNSWLRRFLGSFSGGEAISYQDMNALAEAIPVGSDGVKVYPYGNGAERTLGNRHTGAQILGLDLNRHSAGHVVRATQEGILYALYLGFEIMQEMGMNLSAVRAGRANMFLSPIFRQSFASLTGAEVELYETDGATGAARAAGIGIGLYGIEGMGHGLQCLATIEPKAEETAALREHYAAWKAGVGV